MGLPMLLFHLGNPQERGCIGTCLRAGLRERDTNLALQLPELLRRVWDCFATLSLFKGVRSGKESKLFREEHSSLTDGILGKWDRRKASDYPGKFERDIRNWYLLDRLEWLTVEIVEFDGLRSGGQLTPLVSSRYI